MPVVKIDLDQTTYEKLVQRAAAERRPASYQAEIEIRRRFGLWPQVGDPADQNAGAELVGAKSP